jgi:hypothetical protein
MYPFSEEQEGFEPPEPFGPSVFKTDAIGHSTTAPFSDLGFPLLLLPLFLAAFCGLLEVHLRVLVSGVDVVAPDADHCRTLQARPCFAAVVSRSPSGCTGLLDRSVACGTRDLHQRKRQDSNLWDLSVLPVSNRVP